METPSARPMHCNDGYEDTPATDQALPLGFKNKISY